MDIFASPTTARTTQGHWEDKCISGGGVQMLWPCTHQLDRHTIVMATPAFPGRLFQGITNQITNTPLDAIATTACSMDVRHLRTKMLSAKGGMALTEPQL